MKPLLALLLMTVPALGCSTIAQDKALVAAQGIADYIGVVELPWTEGLVVLYRVRATNLTVFSPVIDGCVLKQTLVLGKFKARVEV